MDGDGIADRAADLRPPDRRLQRHVPWRSRGLLSFDLPLVALPCVRSTVTTTSPGRIPAETGCDEELGCAGWNFVAL